MKTANQLNDSEHSPIIPIDPFAVDFFGGRSQNAGDDETFVEDDSSVVRRLKLRKKSDWHKNLPQFTNKEAEFSNLLTNLPENFTEQTAKLINETLARYTFREADKVDCSLISVTEANLNQAIEKLSDSAKVFLTIKSENENARLIASLNTEFASGFIDAVLDGQNADFQSRRVLSPIEMTIVEFLCANVLSAINEHIGEPMLFLESVKDKPAELFEPFERGAEVVLRLSLGDFSGIISLFVSQKFLRFLDRSQTSLYRNKTERKKIGDYEKIVRELSLRLQIGTTFLDSESLLYLEPEDVVIIEKPQISLSNENLSSISQVYVGRGTNFRMRGIAEDNGFNGNLIFKIDEILNEESRRKFTPAKLMMDEKEQDLAEETVLESDSTAVEATDEEEILEEPVSTALENVQVALRVEIAGSRISLRELQNLRAGQIIALGCSPNDPVRLVTDSSEDAVATGELIDIEGQLGVRLTKVFI